MDTKQARKMLADLKRQPDARIALKALDKATLTEIRDALPGQSREIAERLDLRTRSGEPLADPDRYVRGLIRGHSNAEIIASADDETEAALHKLLLQKRGQQFGIEGLADALNVAPKRVRCALIGLSEKGICIEQCADAEAVSLPAGQSPIKRPVPMGFYGRDMVFGAVTDTHLGSRYATPDFLEAVYDHFAAEGIEHVLHCGDLNEGPGDRGYAGHCNDVIPETQHWDGAEEYASRVYPARPGMVTHVISSAKSHDGWEWTKTGRDMCRDICNGRAQAGDIPALPPRDDLIYHGQDAADLLLGPENMTRIRLFHPAGGSAYALSYRPQKFIEQFVPGTKPHIFLVGHYHRDCSIGTRNVRALSMAGGQYDSPLFRQLGLQPEVGAYIIRATLDTGGSLVRYSVENLLYYYRDNIPHAE